MFTHELQHPIQEQRCPACHLLKTEFQITFGDRHVNEKVCTDCFYKYLLTNKNKYHSNGLFKWIHKRNRSIPTLTERQWNKILTMQNNKCAICGQEFSNDLPPVKDHILPYSKGGNLTYGNTQALCKSCNSRKKNQFDISKAINTLVWQEV